MWKTIIISILLLIVSTANAQTQSLVDKKQWASLEIVFGRISLINPRFIQSRSCSRGIISDGIGETYSTSIRDDLPSMHYELLNEGQHLTINIIDSNDVTIIRQANNNSKLSALEFLQPIDGPLQLKITVLGQSSMVYTADGFWRLFLENPEICKEHLLPILRHLRPNWGLQKALGNIHDNSFKIAEITQFPNRKQANLFITEFKSLNYKTRNNATKNLLDMSLSILPFLKEVDRSKLDAEQHRRINKIIKSFTPNTADTPYRIASWHLSNKDVWSVLLKDEDPARRSIAEINLKRIEDSLK